RPISDMADRSHGIHVTRLLPGLGTRLCQGLLELLMTVGGIGLLDWRSALFAVGLVVVALGIPALAQPMIRERDLRMRNHSGALGGFYLDALLALVPARAHRAERAVRRQHEGLLVEWVRAGRRRLTLMTCVDGAQAMVCFGIAGWLLLGHFMRVGAVSGSD